MKRAYCMIRENIRERHNAFVEGLLSVDYEVVCGVPRGASEGDVLLIWNRRGEQELIADRFEKAGGTVLVAEEGYIRRDRFYALARRYHNGGGQELVNDPSRVSLLGVEPAPWRSDGDHVLVCPNRFIGPRAALMPFRWGVDTAARMKKMTGREVRLRPHPGRDKSALVNGRSLADDLAGAALCVVWWSSTGVAALLAGIPVMYCAPWWIASSAAAHGIGKEAPRGDRRPALERIANSQFLPAEIAEGLPFRSLVWH